MGEETTRTTLTREGTEGTAAAGGQPQSPGWRAGLPAELREHEWLKGFSKVGEFATAALQLKERAEKAIVRPGENATESERQAFDRALGVPEREDGYTLEVPKPPDGIEPTTAFLADFKKIAAKSRLTKEQAKGIFESLYGKVYETLSAQKKAEAEEEAREKADLEKAEAALRSEWKGEYENKVAAAGKLVVALGGQELATELDATGLGNSTRLIRAFARMAELVKPDTLERGNAAAATATKEQPKRLQYPWMREHYGKPSE